MIDPANPVVALCVAGVQVEGTPHEARRLFEQAWAARRDDYDACIAAHYLARHQPSPADTLRWNQLAAQHAEAVSHDRVRDFLPSLYLNLAHSLLETGDTEAARSWAGKATACLETLEPGGYREFVARGIESLHHRLSESAT